MAKGLLRDFRAVLLVEPGIIAIPGPIAKPAGNN